mmetsp:Transcript_39144/g.112549  ORF Transcript_39144/g.112549 Transcript_39144/m.112549 type:complete len:215 (-) Transcript_39144:1051-1695(-)
MRRSIQSLSSTGPPDGSTALRDRRTSASPAVFDKVGGSRDCQPSRKASSASRSFSSSGVKRSTGRASKKRSLASSLGGTSAGGMAPRILMEDMPRSFLKTSNSPPTLRSNHCRSGTSSGMSAVRAWQTARSLHTSESNGGAPSAVLASMMLSTACRRSSSASVSSSPGNLLKKASMPPFPPATAPPAFPAALPPLADAAPPKAGAAAAATDAAA